MYLPLCWLYFPCSVATLTESNSTTELSSHIPIATLKQEGLDNFPNELSRSRLLRNILPHISRRSVTAAFTNMWEPVALPYKNATATETLPTTAEIRA